MSYYSLLLGQNTTTKATYKRKCLIGFMVLGASARGGRAKAWQQEQLRAHIPSVRGDRERDTGKGPLQVQDVLSLQLPMCFPL